jgi:hypothetical protein
VASPLDLLNDWQREDVDAAVAATRLGWVDSVDARVSRPLLIV